MATYHDRLREAAEEYRRLQNPDDGWGLRPGQASSIVNTAEVLAIFAASRLSASNSSVLRAIDYLVQAVRTHPAAKEDGGRGRRPRYVSFGLLGLTEYRPTITGKVRDAVAHCYRWLEQTKTADGWPEEVGGADPAGLPSLPQTATATVALARVEPLGRLVQAGRDAVLREQLASGAWPQTRTSTRPGPSNTALAVLALTDADDSASRLAVTRGKNWLLENRAAWERQVEADPDALGTSWLHMTFSLGLRACLAAGVKPWDPRLAVAIDFLDELWSAGARQWREGAEDANPSVRGSYGAVLGYEGMKESFGSLDPLELLVRTAARRRTRAGPLPPGMRLRILGRPYASVEDASGFGATIDLGNRWRIVRELAVHGAAGHGTMSRGDFVELCGVEKDSSLRSLLSRLNTHVERETGGRVPKLVEGTGDAGYRLVLADVVVEREAAVPNTP